MATTATVQPELGQTVYIYAWFNFLRPIGFCFSKEGPDIHCARLTWMAWPGSGQTHFVWKQASVQQSLGLVSGRTQPAHYQLLAFRLRHALPQVTQIILCKTSPVPVWFWLTVRFWPNRSGPEASRCARIIWPLLPTLWVRTRPGRESDPVCFLGHTLRRVRKLQPRSVNTLDTSLCRCDSTWPLLSVSVGISCLGVHLYTLIFNDIKLSCLQAGTDG